MNYFKRKAPPFILGLLLGIVIAGTFFILRLDNYFRELSFYKNLAKTFSSQQSTNESLNDTIKSITSAKIKNKKQNTEFAKKNDDLPKNQTEIDSLPSIDSTIKTGYFSDNIVIRKDELLTVRTIELKNLNTPIIKNHQDSLLEKISEIRDDKQPMNKLMQIEFWKSPLNYKGYKLSKYNVILYGLIDTENLKLFTLDDVFYIRNSSATYRLDYNSDFKPYERVVDENILNNIK